MKAAELLGIRTSLFWANNLTRLSPSLESKIESPASFRISLEPSPNHSEILFSRWIAFAIFALLSRAVNEGGGSIPTSNSIS